MSSLDQKSERDKPAELVRLSVSGRLHAVFPKLRQQEGLAARAERDATLRVGNSAPVPGRVKAFIGLLAITSFVLVHPSPVANKPAGTALLKAQSGGQATAAGTIEGQVTFEGPKIPGPSIIENATDPEFCGIRHSLEDVLISTASRGLQNVIVAVRLPEGVARLRSQGQKLILDNRKCRFQPHVAVLTTGSVIEAVNGDNIFHTTHLYYGPLSKNLALNPGGRANQTANRPGFIIVKCDIHGWMKAFIRVDTHPFHAVSDAEGRFRISGVPEGSYTLELWHEQFGAQAVPVVVTRSKTTILSIQYRK